MRKHFELIFGIAVISILLVGIILALACAPPAGYQAYSAQSKGVSSTPSTYYAIEVYYDRAHGVLIYSTNQGISAVYVGNWMNEVGGMRTPDIVKISK